MTFLYTLTRKQKEKKVFSLRCIQKSNVIKKKNLGFSIWIYVFGFSWCNGLIKSDIIFCFEGSNLNLLHKAVKIVILAFSIWRFYSELNYNSEAGELIQSRYESLVEIVISGRATLSCMKRKLVSCTSITSRTCDRTII